MILLGLDSATSACSAAVLRGEDVAAHRFEVMQRGHVEALVPMVEAVMDEAGADYAALDAVAVTVGPGSFTGLRAGLAAAQGIARARGIPLLGFTTLEVIAWAAVHGPGAHAAAVEGATLAVAIETRRADIYLQCFSAVPAPRCEPACMTVENAVEWLPSGPVVLGGDAATRLPEALAKAGRVVKMASAPGAPDASDLVRMAGALCRAATVAAVAARAAAAPVYLHPPHATVPEDRGKLLK